MAAINRLKDLPAHMVEGGRQPRNRPPTLGTMSVDFCHNPVMKWAYSTPQPNTEVPVPTGGRELGHNGLTMMDDENGWTCGDDNDEGKN